MGTRGAQEAEGCEDAGAKEAGTELPGSDGPRFAAALKCLAIPRTSAVEKCKPVDEKFSFGKIFLFSLSTLNRRG